MVSHSPATIHFESGEMASNELLYSSPGTSVWTYCVVAPFGLVTRNIFVWPDDGPWKASTMVPAAESGSPMWPHPSAASGAGTEEIPR